MRRMCPLLALIVAGGCAGLALAGGLGPAGGSCASCNGGHGTYAAPACSAPVFGMVPGCCERQPSPCDSVWASYCQERERAWQWLGYNRYPAGSSPMNPIGPGGPVVTGPAPEAFAPQESSPNDTPASEFAPQDNGMPFEPASPGQSPPQQQLEPPPAVAPEMPMMHAPDPQPPLDAGSPAIRPQSLVIPLPPVD